MRRTDFIYLLFIFIGGCLSPVISHASTFMPIVTNYTAKDYQAGLQNWALAQGKNGEMYIGNNSAATLLVYLNTLPYGANSRISKRTMMKYGIYSK